MRCLDINLPQRCLRNLDGCQPQEFVCLGNDSGIRHRQLPLQVLDVHAAKQATRTASQSRAKVVALIPDQDFNDTQVREASQRSPSERAQMQRGESECNAVSPEICCTLLLRGHACAKCKVQI